MKIPLELPSSKIDWANDPAGYEWAKEHGIMNFGIESWNRFGKYNKKTKQCDFEVSAFYISIDFDFSENEKSLLKLKDEIGSV